MREPGYSLVTLEADPFRFARTMLAIAVLSACAHAVVGMVDGHEIPPKVGTSLLILCMLVVMPHVSQPSLNPVVPPPRTIRPRTVSF